MLEAKVYVDSNGCEYKVDFRLTGHGYWVCYRDDDINWWIYKKYFLGFGSFDEAQQCLDLEAKSKGWKEVK